MVILWTDIESGSELVKSDLDDGQNGHLISNLKNTRNDDPDPFATIEVCGAWYWRPSSLQLVACGRGDGGEQDGGG